MIEFLNKPDMCIVCFMKPETDFALIKHHVAYFPEKIAFVHYACHKKIHDDVSSLWIQYADGDARKFYDLQKSKK